MLYKSYTMAKAGMNLLLQQFSGRLGKQFVVKQYKNKIVLTAYPQVKKKKPTELSLIYRKRFTEAVKYTRSILANPELKASYEAKLEPGQRVCDYAMREYLQQAKAGIDSTKD